MENSSRSQNCLVKRLLTKFLLTKNLVPSICMFILKSSLGSKMHLSIHLPSCISLAIRDNKPTKYIYYFLQKPYRKKKHLIFQFFPKININVLNALTYFKQHFPRNASLYFKSYLYYTLNINGRQSYWWWILQIPKLINNLIANNFRDKGSKTRFAYF